METLNNVPPLMGVLGLVCAVIIYFLMVRYPEGDEKIRKIAAAIHEGAMVFLHREYLMLALFAGALFLIIFFTPGLGWKTAVAFAVGAICSAAAGYIGMFAATKANVRTTTAATECGRGRRTKCGVLRRFHYGTLRRITGSVGARRTVLVLRRRP